MVFYLAQCSKTLAANSIFARLMTSESFKSCICDLNTQLCSVGNVYNIPICIWLMDTHPYNAPMCYVKPTYGMHIKVSIFVDHNGKIYLPYLHDWVPVSNIQLPLNFYPADKT
jgi:hypothetical protein